MIAALDRSHLDALYEAQHRHSPGALGDNATKEFILRHVFGIAPELVQQPSDLLRSLLRRHHRGLRFPKLLDDHLIRVLRQNGAFAAWPLEVIVSDREAFFAFLQERWPHFLDRYGFEGRTAVETVAETTTPYGLEFRGPVDLPFDHDDVRVFMDNLFLEGMLEPIAHPRAENVTDTWAVVGVRIDPAADRQRRWEGLFEAVSEGVPGPGARHQEWQAFALKWSQLIALRHRLGKELDGEKSGAYEELRDRVDGGFLAWVEERYGTLHNQPALPPVMVHHVPRLLARHLEDERNGKVALVIVDGLALDRWIVAHEVLRAQRPDLRLREATIFAWIPSLTMVSRQACFAGRAPLYFPASIHTTDKEPKSWKRFWEDEGLGPAELGYEKNIRDASDLERIDHLTSHPKLRAVGLVADKVDKIMHGMELGTAGMHNQVRQWVEQGVLADLLDMLLERRFAVFLTADHGNVEASGCGRPGEGSLADLRGARARVFNDASLRSRVQERFPDAIAWPPIGLPNDYLALIAPHRAAFVREDEKLVGHGGITVEEVIVPLVRIERR